MRVHSEVDLDRLRDINKHESQQTQAKLEPEAHLSVVSQVLRMFSSTMFTDVFVGAQYMESAKYRAKSKSIEGDQHVCVQYVKHHEANLQMQASEADLQEERLRQRLAEEEALAEKDGVKLSTIIQL